MINLYTNPIPESAKFRSESIQFDKKVQIWCIFLISLYTNSIPESAKNRISKCSDGHTQNRFLRALQPKSGQMSNTKVMSPDRQTDRTDRTGQTDEHNIFEAHYTMGPSGNKEHLPKWRKSSAGSRMCFSKNVKFTLQ